MFNVIPNPTFPGSLTIVGQGREQTLNVVYKHFTTDEVDALLTALSEGKKTAADVVIELVESWDADLPFDEAGVRLLQKHQPGCLAAIIADYTSAFTVARKGN